MIFDRFIGFHVDAMSVGVVGMELSKNAGYEHVPGTRNNLRPVYHPEVCFSYYKEGVSLSDGIDILGGSIGPSTKVIIEGKASKSLVYNEIRKQLGIKPKNFYDTQAKLYSIDEIVMAILDDIRNDVITTRESFQGTPEREELMSHLSQIDSREDNLTAIQSAFIWAAGFWSVSRTRKKWRVGRTPDVRVW